MSQQLPPTRRPEEDAAERARREEQHELLAELLAGYADGELPAETRAQIDAHLVGCARCRRELAVHHAVRRRLGEEPPVAAPPALRERIQAAVAATPLPAAPVRQGAERARRAWLGVLLLAALAVLGAVGVGTSRYRAEHTIRVEQLEGAPAASPLVRAVLADYRRVTSGDLPGRARDIDAVRAALPFAVEPLHAPGARLLAAWTTTLDGDPAAVLAYRWRGQLVLEYLVPEERLFRSPLLRSGGAGRRLVGATDGALGLVSWSTGSAGVLLVAELPPERLAPLAAADVLAKRARAGAE